MASSYINYNISTLSGLFYNNIFDQSYYPIETQISFYFPRNVTTLSLEISFFTYKTAHVNQLIEKKKWIYLYIIIVMCKNQFYLHKRFEMICSDHQIDIDVNVSQFEWIINFRITKKCHFKSFLSNSFVLISWLTHFLYEPNLCVLKNFHLQTQSDGIVHKLTNHLHSRGIIAISIWFGK